MTTFVLRDHSKDPYSKDDLTTVTKAIIELFDHVANEWGTEIHNAHVEAPGTKLPDTCIELAIFDDDKAASKAGYHSTDPRGMPYGHIFKSDVEHLTKGKRALTVLAGRRALVHALLPFDIWVDRDGGVEELLSLADRVAGTTYDLSPEVDLPNFILPSVVKPGPSEPPYDMAEALESPTKTPGGYAVVRSVGFNAARKAGAIQMAIGMAVALDGADEVPYDELRRLGHPSSHARRRGLADLSVPKENGAVQKVASP